MKTPLHNIAICLSMLLGSVPIARAGDEGFTVILDQAHTDGWKHIGDGGMTVKEGVASTISPKQGSGGMYLYQKAAFGDFTLKLEFKMDTRTSNSGILVRFPDPGSDYNAAASKGYEVDIYGEKTGTIISPSDRVRPKTIVPLNPGDWNECEVSVIGQKYTVKLRDQVVNEFTGSRGLNGYIGLQNWKGEGEMHFRNIRIKELPSANGIDSGVASSGPAKEGETFIEVLSEQAPNALEWALAPLDRTTPPDIRKSLMLLRESLLDEEARKPSASAGAYKLGQELCNSLIAAFNERDKTLVRAGYSSSQAEANLGAVTNQSLEARRRFMNWPAYFREKDQREELRKQKENGAAQAKQRPVLEWSDRGAQIRKIVDALYAQYREAARRPTAK